MATTSADFETIKHILLEMPPAEWCDLADTTASDELQLYADKLDAIAEQATRAATYLRARGDGRTHTRALDAQNAKAKAVRKALGFTYPDQPRYF